MHSRAALFAASAALLAATPAVANPMMSETTPRPHLVGDIFMDSFFGEDINNKPGGEELLPGERVNASAAQASFLAAVGGFIARESFEGFDEGHDFSTQSTFLPFEGLSAGANNDRGRVRETPGGMANEDGRYSTDGDKFLSANTILNGSFRIEFVEAQDAFGFYGIDVGDFDAQLTLTFELVAGGTHAVDVPHSLFSEGANSGSVFFWGVVDEKNLFTAVTFSGHSDVADDRDVFGFDELQIRGTGEPIVPLPSSVGLALAGLAPIIGRRRRRLA